jgi:hypothetical protein
MRSVPPQAELAEAFPGGGEATPALVVPSFPNAGRRPAAAPQVRFCAECGAAAPGVAGFCGHCGQKLIPSQAPVSGAAPDDRAPFGAPTPPSDGIAVPSSGVAAGAAEFSPDEGTPWPANERPLNPMVEAAFQWWERTSAFSPMGSPQPAGSGEAGTAWHGAIPDAASDGPASGANRYDEDAPPWFQPRPVSPGANPAPPPHGWDVPQRSHSAPPPAGEPAPPAQPAVGSSSSAAEDSLTLPYGTPTAAFPDSRRARPIGRLILGIGAATVIAAAFWAPRLKHRPALTPAPPAPALPGHLSVQVPDGVDPALLSVTVLRDHRLAETLEARPLDEVAAAELTAQPLRAGVYQIRFTYRKKLLAEATTEVRAGQSAAVQPAARELAEVEYEAGLRCQGSPEEKGCFEHVLRLDPNHVNAHLQLAAYEMVHGDRPAAGHHLAAVRRLDPHNADAVALTRLLRKEKGRRP